MSEIILFLWACKKHYGWWVGGLSVTIAALLTSLPHWLIWPWLIVGLFVSAFFAWRDEHRKLEVALAELAAVRDVKSKQEIAEAETMYQTAADAIASGTYPLAALLLAKADALKDNQHVIWLCEDLERWGHEHPFKAIAVVGGPLERSEWLAFLQEAKRRGSKLSNVMEATRVRLAILDDQQGAG